MRSTTQLLVLIVTVGGVGATAQNDRVQTINVAEAL